MPRKPKPINRKAKKHRVVLDMNTKSLEVLDGIKDLMEFDSRAAAIRHALSVYSWFLQEQASGKDLFVGSLPDPIPPTLTKVKLLP